MLATKVEIRVEISYQQQILMHGEVEEAIWDQVNEVEILPVAHIDWGARIAVFGEKDGGIYIYVEFNMKVIPYLLPKTFPLQTPCR